MILLQKPPGQNKCENNNKQNRLQTNNQKKTKNDSQDRVNSISIESLVQILREGESLACAEGPLLELVKAQT